jgi:SAM-dependent methyltransferase
MSGFWRSGTDYDIESESLQLRRFGEPFLIEFLNSEELNYKKPITVDFGCWSGRHLQLLERDAETDGKSEYAKNRVIGIDEPFAKERIRQARRAYRDYAIFDEGIRSTGLPSSTVDAAISWRVLHNLIKPGEWTAALLEMKRVLKHGAPFVVAVRATQEWMTQNSPIPLIYRTFSYGVDRDDLYFSESACYATFRFYGFDIPFKAERFSEEEIIDGTRVKNDYWMVALLCNKRIPYIEYGVGEVPYSTPVDSEFITPPTKRLANEYK